MPENSNIIAARLFPLYVVGAFAAIFYLPYFIPLAPSASSSYLFGYNNKAGVALLLSFVAVGAVWTRGLRLNFLGVADGPWVSRRTLAYSLVAVLLGCAAMYLLAGRLGGFGESSYEIDRIWLTSIGKRPYVDFEWPFGLALLYGPLALCRLLPLNIPQAYYLFWALNCLLGVWLLYAVVNSINYPTPRKRQIFLLICCAWFPAIINMGTHYSLTRYALPLYFILCVQRQIQRDHTFPYARSSGLILLFTAFLFLYSPETAIAFGLASCALVPILVDWKRPRFFYFLGTLLPGLALLVWAASKLHVLDTVKASGGGADSFPIVFSLHILLLFGAVFVCACYVYQRLVGQPLKDNTLALITYSLPMLPAALGRCDPGHVLLNCLGIFLASLFYVSGSRVLWKVSRVAFIVILIAFPAFGGLWLYIPSLARCGVALLTYSNGNNLSRRSVLDVGRAYIRHFAPPDKKQRWQERLETLVRGDRAETVDVTEMYPEWHDGYLAPFGYKPNGFGTDLKGQVDYGRYEGVENANTPAAIEEKLSEIREHPGKALLLPDQYETFCKIDIRAERQEIEFLFASPYFKIPAHLESPRQPICAYIQEHYSLVVQPSAGTQSYGIWIKRENASDRSPFFEHRIASK